MGLQSPAPCLPIVGLPDEIVHEVDVRITTGKGASQHSHHTFPITVMAGTQSAPAQDVYEPDQGEVTYLVFDKSPFATEALTEVRIDAGGNDGWYIEMVEVKDKDGHWRVWGIEDMGCKQGHWVDGDSNHPAYLAFSRCHEINVRITTGGGKNDDSIHNFDVELIKDGSHKVEPYPQVKSPNRYDIDLIRVVSSFPVNELTEVKIDDNGVDGWFVEAVEVQDEDGVWQQWGIANMKCQHSAWVDYPGLLQGDGAISFKQCDTPRLTIVGQINVRVHTGPGILSGSVHDFPIAATSEKAHDFTVPVNVRAPAASSTQYIALDSTFPLNELSTIRIDHGGLDGWAVEGIEVEDEFGAWSYWGIKDMNCKKSANIDGNSNHPKFLQFSKCNEIQVLIVTETASGSGSAADFEVEFVTSAGAGIAPVTETVASPGEGGTDLVHAVSPFAVSELTEVRVRDADSNNKDTWRIKSLHVLDENNVWQRWGLGSSCLLSGEATRTSFLGWTDCSTHTNMNQVNLRLKVDQSPFSHNFPVTVYSTLGTQVMTTVDSPVRAGWEYITLESPFPVASVSRVHIGKGNKDWTLDALEIEDEHMQWSMLGVQDRSCRAGDKLDDSGLTYVACLQHTGGSHHDWAG